MEPSRYETALIVGAGSGLSASLARLFVREGMAVGLAARNPDKLGGLCDVTGARAFACDATDPEQVERLFGAVEKGIGVLPRRHGAVLFTGASASVKGYPQSAPFAMGKFALRGLAQSMARELAPQGIHVAHFIIDGAIRNPGRTEPPDKPQSMLDPDAIALNYLHILRQPRSAWTWELELRPWVERF